MLKVDTAGKVIISSESGGASDDGVFKRTAKSSPTEKNNIYLALDDGTASVAGKPSLSSTQSYLRVGTTNNNDEPEKEDTAMVVGGVIESRGGLFIKKVNADAEKSNSTDNRKVKVTEDYTSLDLNTREGKVNFISNNKDSLTNNLPTSFIFSADGASTKLGINTTDAPIATLDVVGDTAISQALILGMNDYTALESPDLDPGQAMII